MDISFRGEFKSLSDFTILDIPRLMVVIGQNGVGKSQFLELIESGVKSRRDPTVEFSDESYAPQDLLLLTSEWENLTNKSQAGLASIQNQHQEHWGRFQKYVARGPSDSYSHLHSVFEQLCLGLDKEPCEVTKDEFIQHMDLSVPRERVHVFNQTIAQAFVDFRMREIEAAARGESLDAVSPWELVQDIIAEANLPFSFTDPSKMSIRGSYDFVLNHTVYDRPVKFDELSSGEKVLMSLVFWIFHVRRTNVFPRLLLLDEPDAHLHPEKCHQLFRVLDEVMVKKHDVRVIVTTHNPATVELAPRSSLFEIFADGERIRRVKSKSDAIRRLTGGLLNVSLAKSIVIVEDEIDEKLFQSLFDELLRMEGPVSEGLRSAEKLVFVQASRPRKQRKGNDTTGGRSEVMKWVPKLRSAGLDVVVGLVDRDYECEAGESVYILDRYSIENYLVDPILIYARLVAEQVAPQISGIPELSRNRAHLLTEWNQSQLQVISDHIVDLVKSKLPDEEGEGECKLQEDRVRVEFTNELILEYPRWLCDRRGKDLLRAAIEAFGGNNINQAKLIETFLHLMFVPMELVDLFRRIQDRSVQ